jgi:hypothetical protein
LLISVLFPTSFRLPAECYHPARLAPCHSPPPEMAARRKYCKQTSCKVGPALYQRHRHCVPRGLRARHLTPRISPFHEKNEYREVRVVRWRIPSIWSPNTGASFTRGHQLASILSLVFSRATHPRARWRPGDFS